MNKRKVTLAIAGAAIAFFTLTAEGCDKAVEQYQDAPIGKRDASGPADIVNMPDGYANVATKCNNGNRVYVTTVGDMQGNGGAARAVAVVPADPTCKGE